MHKLSETNYRGTGCGKAARPGLWGSGEITNRSTRKLFRGKIIRSTGVIMLQTEDMRIMICYIYSGTIGLFVRNIISVSEVEQIIQHFLHLQDIMMRTE